MSWNAPNCPECHQPTRFDAPSTEGPDCAAALSWLCDHCGLRVLELIPPGRLDTQAGDCLNCGAHLDGARRCPECGVDHEQIVARIREHCGLPPVLDKLDVLRDRGLYRVALNAVELRLQQHPDDADALAMRGKLLLDLLMPAMAARALQRALAAGAVPETAVSLGVALADSGRQRAAIGVYERFLSEHPQHPNRATVLSNIGGCHSALGRGALGESYHRQAIAADPEHLFPRWNLFANLLGRGRATEAIQVIDETLELAWLEADVRENLQAFRADVLLGLGQLPEALAAIDASLLGDPGEPNRQHTRARILMQLGRYEDARLALLLVLERVPGSRSAQLLLQTIARAQGQQPN